MNALTIADDHPSSQTSFSALDFARTLTPLSRADALPSRPPPGKVLTLPDRSHTSDDDLRERLAHLRGALRLAGASVDLAAGIAQDMHRAIADPPLELVARTSVGELARATHDGVRDGVYACVRGLSRLVFGTLDRALERVGPAIPPPPPLPGPLLGVLHGVVGDHLARDLSPMCTAMQLRHRGRALPITRPALAAAFPEASARVVVMVHGLAADESCWQRGSARAWGREGLDYGQLLAERCDLTPLYLRYNSGLPIADNGRDLAKLLNALIAAYPVEIRELVLLGHSMGGLVVRSACHLGRAAGDPWTARVRDVICLGSPHRGAVLEKLGAAAVAALNAIPVTAPIARAFDLRSAGIKDLRHGLSRDDETPDNALPNARYHYLAGTLGKPGNPLGWAFGDGLVRVASAAPRGRDHARTATIAGMHHIDMLNHPEVLAWLEAALVALQE